MGPFPLHTVFSAYLSVLLRIYHNTPNTAYFKRIHAYYDRIRVFTPPSTKYKSIFCIYSVFTRILHVMLIHHKYSTIHQQYCVLSPSICWQCIIRMRCIIHIAIRVNTHEYTAYSHPACSNVNAQEIRVKYDPNTLHACVLRPSRTV